MELLPTDSPHAVLRADPPSPTLSLWDNLPEYVVPEYGGYSLTIPLRVQLKGEMGFGQTAVDLDLEDLVNLIEGLHDLTALRALTLEWQAHYRMVEIRLSVQMQKLGPPVLCDLRIQQGTTGTEEYQCRFETNLTWVAQFLAELEQMGSRYQQVRRLQEQSQFPQATLLEGTDRVP